LLHLCRRGSRFGEIVKRISGGRRVPFHREIQRTSGRLIARASPDRDGGGGGETRAAHRVRFVASALGDSDIAHAIILIVEIRHLESGEERGEGGGWSIAGVAGSDDENRSPNFPFAGETVSRCAFPREIPRWNALHLLENPSEVAGSSVPAGRYYRKDHPVRATWWRSYIKITRSPRAGPSEILPRLSVLLDGTGRAGYVAPYPRARISKKARGGRKGEREREREISTVARRESGALDERRGRSPSLPSADVIVCRRIVLRLQKGGRIRVTRARMYASIDRTLRVCSRDQMSLRGIVPRLSRVI